MSKKTFMICSLFFVALLSSLTGCASFKGNQLPAVGKLPPSATGVEKPDITFKFSAGESYIVKREHYEGARQQLESEFAQVLRESGYFAAVTEGSEGKGIHINAKLVNSGSPIGLIPAFITGLSLYTIPSWATDNFEVTAKVTTVDGREHTYSLTDSSTLVQWLPMVFAFPFKNPLEVPVEVRKNIYRNLILKMQEDGVLSMSGKRLKQAM